MHPRLQLTKSITISLAFHALIIVALVYLVKPDTTPLPVILPVNIVNIPQQAMKKLPSIQPPAPIVPHKPLLPSEVPLPKKFSDTDEVQLPRSLPRPGKASGAEQNKEPDKAERPPRNNTGPLPFLSQKDIDDLARKGMPSKKPGDDSVTLDTDEFKFISYNRWLVLKGESMLRYPELASLSGYQGTVYLKFDILKNGALGELELLKSSGYKILDDEAMRAIRASAPFQPLPDEWHMERYSIRAAVLFYLGSGYIR